MNITNLLALAIIKGSICLGRLVLVRNSEPGALPCQTARNELGVTTSKGSSASKPL